MFPHYDEVQDSSANALSGYSFPLNATNVDIVYKSGGDASGQYLSISAKPVATPSITSGYEFLYSSASIGTKAPIYSFVSPKSNGIIDIYYWVFCPYNLGKDVLIAGWTGDHVGDWEYMMVRTVDYEVVSVDYHAHSSTGGTYLATDPTIVWNGTHPIVYTAEGSHGMWPVAGSNVYKTILDIYDLTDDTGAGVAWYTWNNVYAIDYLENRGYTGNQQWLNFDGYFGNPKDTSCLLYSIIGECEFSEGPATPNRGFMAGPPMDVLCTVNSADADHSVYTFQLSAAAQAWAIANGTVNFVAVHQHCTASPSSEATDNWGFIAFDASTGVQSYTVTTDRCKKDYSRYASNYEVGFCSSDAEADCFTVSGLRSLIEYVGDSRPSNPDKNVVVNDLDVWSWSY
ncbi:Vacuolar protein sorting-associated protein 62 [Entophlyctis luteolus]|nr:Vacuolar protein sorting-associated protein 62 [Entophlyctis luteolus]